MECKNSSSWFLKLIILCFLIIISFKKDVSLLYRQQVVLGPFTSLTAKDVENMKKKFQSN